MFYSKLEGLFYPSDHPADDLPGDVVDLSDSEYAALLSAKFYAESTSGFYSIEMHGNKIPADAVEITDAEYRSLLDGQSTGLMISSAPGGRPVLIERPPRSSEELSAAALSKRDALLSVTAIRIAPLQTAVELDNATEVDVAKLKKWKQYQVAVNRVPDQVGFPNEIVWPLEPS